MNLFISWIALKERLHCASVERHFKEREIFYAHVGYNVGHEQNGKGKSFLRPIVIVRKFNKHLLWAVPLSTSTKIGIHYYTFSFIKEKSSTAVLSQIRLMDSRRLMNKIGMISRSDFKELKNRIHILLGY